MGLVFGVVIVGIVLGLVMNYIIFDVVVLISVVLIRVFDKFVYIIEDLVGLVILGFCNVFFNSFFFCLFGEFCGVVISSFEIGFVYVVVWLIGLLLLFLVIGLFGVIMVRYEVCR